MQMTEKEICESYKYAIDQKKQVKILAELNATGRQQIVEILEANGFKVDKRICNKGKAPENKAELIEKLKPQLAVLMPKETDNLAELITSLRGMGAKLTIEVTL